MRMTQVSQGFKIPDVQLRVHVRNRATYLIIAVAMVGLVISDLRSVIDSCKLVNLVVAPISGQSGVDSHHSYHAPVVPLLMIPGAAKSDNVY